LFPYSFTISAMARSAVPGCILAVLVILSICQAANGHGFLQVPKSRNYIANQQGRDYCPHCLSAGGPGTTQPLTPGGLFPNPETTTSAVRHTMCGESATTPAGSRSYNPSPVPSMASLPVYAPGAEFDMTIQITAHHRGHFEFRLCDASKLSDPTTVTWACLNQHVLQRVSVPGEVSPVDVNHPERYYLEPECAPEYNKTVWMKYRMPADVTCERCVIQWWWITANSCNPPDYANRSPQPAHVATGCQWWQSNLPVCSTTYPEEFWNCADVRIVGNATPQPALVNTEPQPAAPTPVAAPAQPAAPAPLAPPPTAPPAVPPAVPAQPAVPVAPGQSECPDYDNSNGNLFNAASPTVGYVGGNSLPGWKWSDAKWSVYDMLVVAFVTRWSLTGPCGSAGLWDGLPGYPNLVTAACEWSAPTTCEQVVNCVTTGINADKGAVGVAKYQDKGRRKVIISLGGANADATFANAAQGTRLAEVIWELYLGGTNTSYAPLRPFGPVILDGVDLDLEQFASFNTETTKGWGNFIVRMRQLMDADSRKAYYITGAPINPTFSDDWGGQEQYGVFPDIAPCWGNMGVNVALPSQSVLTVAPQMSVYGQMSAVDYLFPQFYNTPEHNFCAGQSTTACTVPAGKCYRYDFRQWVAVIRKYGGGRTRMVMGLPLSVTGSSNGFVPASFLNTMMAELLTSFPEAQEVFGGFMGWELASDPAATYANQLAGVGQSLQASGLTARTFAARSKSAAAGCPVAGIVRQEPPAPAPTAASTPALAPAQAATPTQPADVGCARIGWQCGGAGWTGSTCCQQGDCLAYIPEYSECRVGCPAGWLCNQQTTIPPPAQPAVPPTQPAVPPTQPAVPPTQPAVPPTQPAVPAPAPKAPPAAPKAPPAAPKAPPAAPKAPPTVPPTVPPTQPVASQTCNAVGYQCGGSGWTGSTCCSAGTCQAYISTYSQCRTGTCPPGWLCNNEKSLMTQAVDFVKSLAL
jgi:hypothetical protein